MSVVTGPTLSKSRVNERGAGCEASEPPMQSGGKKAKTVRG